MKLVTENIRLERKTETFQASISLVQGKLAELDNHLERLHPKEEAIYNQYKYARRKHSYLLGRLSAKAAVLHLTNHKNPNSVWIDCGIFQFPIIKCPDIHNIQVSISHCEDIGISVAFPDAHPMGIDLEKINKDKKEVLLSQITAKEIQLLLNNKNDSIEGFTCMFSAKEALSKVLKTGMMLDFKYLEIDKIIESDNEIECSFRNFGQYKAYVKAIHNYAIALALPKRTSTDLSPVWKSFDYLFEV